jgi:hypothetical protein
LWFDPLATISYRYHNIPILRAIDFHGQLQYPIFDSAHRLNAVHYQVEKYLLQLHAVARY